MVKGKLEQSIIDALEVRAADHGIDVVDVELVGATKAPCVRIRLDKLEGGPIDLDEVTAQTGWVSEVVEDLDPIAGPYTLEVSSPGMKRPLRRPGDFTRFIGETVDLATVDPRDRRSYKGVIERTTDEDVTIRIADGESVVIPFDDIRKCTLEPVYDFKRSKEGK